MKGYFYPKDGLFYKYCGANSLLNVKSDLSFDTEKQIKLKHKIKVKGLNIQISMTVYYL